MPHSPFSDRTCTVCKFEAVRSLLLEERGYAYEAKNKPINVGSLLNPGNHLGYWGKRRCGFPASLSSSSINSSKSSSHRQRLTTRRRVNQCPSRQSLT